MPMKIMWASAIFFGGWLLAYLFIRQLLFNAHTAFRTIKKMKASSPDLIAVGATRYTLISTLVCSFFVVVVCVIVIRFCPYYYLISFFVGLGLGTLMLWGKMSPDNRHMFDTFCGTYYRFVPDDELRTAMFNKKPDQIKQRLYNLGLARDMVPDFKKED